MEGVKLHGTSRNGVRDAVGEHGSEKLLKFDDYKIPP
jgi:hypothetical protein